MCDVSKETIAECQMTASVSMSAARASNGVWTGNVSEYLPPWRIKSIHSVVSSPSEIWGRAPAKNKFGAFLASQNADS